jgi:hypothetical protein
VGKRRIMGIRVAGRMAEQYRHVRPARLKSKWWD